MTNFDKDPHIYLNGKIIKIQKNADRNRTQVVKYFYHSTDSKIQNCHRSETLQKPIAMQPKKAAGMLGTEDQGHGIVGNHRCVQALQ